MGINSNDYVEHIMLDIETLGTKAGCPILQIAAVGFSLKHDKMHIFNHNVRLEDGELAGLDSSTLKWWLKDPTRMIQLSSLVTSDDSDPVGQVLLDLSCWLARYQEEAGSAQIWGNGADFDNVIITAESVALLGAPLWNFRQNRCYRTVRSMFKDLVPEPQFIGTKHNALDDAVHQAHYLKKLLCYIRDIGTSIKELQSQ